jgi:hypothetical protein
MSNKTIVHIGTLHAKPEHTDNLIASFEGLKQASGSEGSPQNHA